MRKLNLPLFLLIVFVGLLWSLSATAQLKVLGSPERTYPIEGQADPFTMTLYHGRNYANPIGSWTIQPGMRMLKIPKIHNTPRSIFLGSKVGAIIFFGPDFKSHARGYSGSISRFGEESEPTDRYHRCCAHYFESTPAVADLAGGGIFSIVLFRKDVPDFLGVYLQSGENWGQFYSLPERAADTAIVHYKIPQGGRFELEMIQGFSGALSAKKSPSWKDMEVSVAFDNGMTTNLPDQSSSGYATITHYDLHKINNGQIASLKLRYTGPFGLQHYLPPKDIRHRAPPAGSPPASPAEAVVAPLGIEHPALTPKPGQLKEGLEYDTNRPGHDFRNITLTEPRPELCQAACTQDRRCKAFTYVKPGTQGQKARCWLKDRVPRKEKNSCCVSGIK